MSDTVQTTATPAGATTTLKTDDSYLTNQFGKVREMLKENLSEFYRDGNNNKDFLANKMTQHTIDTANQTATILAQDAAGFAGISVGLEKGETAVELSSAKLGAAIALGQAVVSDQIQFAQAAVLANNNAVGASIVANSIADGQRTRDQAQYFADRTRDAVIVEAAKTRELINSNYNETLARQLEDARDKLQEEGRRHDRELSNVQNQSLLSQMQNFQSDLQSAQQGIVNLGTMTGNTQTSANTAIR